MKLGLYIHIPFCTAKCSYCDFVSFDDDNLQKPYVGALVREIGSFDKLDSADCTVDTVFIGGGTPSALYRGGLKEIFAALCKRFSLDKRPPGEFTVEANPETCDAGFLKECADMGVNRLSLGLQTASDRLLKGLRRHTFADFRKAVSLARRHGIKNINADLMLGLPGQTISDVTDSVKILMDFILPHISVYGLKIEPGTPLHKSGYQADDDLAADFYDVARSALKNGYMRYEVSNFCLPGFECRHNLKYWRLEPYLGLGLNASSFIDGVRLKNTANMLQYIKGHYVETRENAAENFVVEYIMLGLRTSGGISINILNERGVDLLKNPKAAEYFDKEILILEGDILTIHGDYWYLMNQIISDLL